MNDTPCCSHSTVKREEISHPGGTCSEHWICSDCGKLFRPASPEPATPCCGYTPKKGVPWPVMWNQYNLLVQCHNCGEVYDPRDSRARPQLTPDPSDPSDNRKKFRPRYAPGPAGLAAGSSILRPTPLSGPRPGTSILPPTVGPSAAPDKQESPQMHESQPESSPKPLPPAAPPA